MNLKKIKNTIQIQAYPTNYPIFILLIRVFLPTPDKFLQKKEYSPDFILYFCKKRLPMLFEELKQRRTIRKYTGEDIPEKLLNELIETACRVSTTGNRGR